MKVEADLTEPDDFDAYVKRISEVGEQLHTEMEAEAPSQAEDPIDLKLPAPREPECGHARRSSWSSCRECAVTRVVIDASGPAPTSGQWEQLGLHLPGVANLITAARTLRIEYEETLLAGRAKADQILVSVVRSDKTYEHSVGRLQITDETIAILQWHLSDTLLAGELRGALSAVDYTRTRLADEASKMKTGLVAPSKKTADTVLASAFVNSYAALKADCTWLDLQRAIEQLPDQSRNRIGAVVDETMCGFAEERERAKTLLSEWLRQVEPLRQQASEARAKRDAILNRSGT